MNKVLNIHKPLGITSYDVIRRLKKEYPGEKIGHAGTLDPLAEGVLICLVGSDATKRQSEFMDVEKEYEFEVLFGFETDTYDALGLIIKDSVYDLDETKQKITSLLTDFKGKIKQSVPPFSAVKIKGKPLYRWYLEGRIKEVEIPVKEVVIKSLEIVTPDGYHFASQKVNEQILTAEGKNVLAANREVLTAKKVLAEGEVLTPDREKVPPASRGVLTKDQIHSEINYLLNKVKTGFRKELVLEKWDESLKDSTQKNFLKLTFKAIVSKGTYVRAIAHELGNSLGVGACTLKIKRVKVGDYSIVDSAKLQEPDV